MMEQSVLIEYDVPATMCDGVTLRSNVTRPGGPGRWPVILNRTPYSKDRSMPGAIPIVDPVRVARQGYVVITQDVRGRFASDGEWEPYRNEWADGPDTVRWAAQLPYSDGRVAMHGASYLGFAQWTIAVSKDKPLPLKAIAPMNTWYDASTGGHTFRDGALDFGNVASWRLQQAIDKMQRKKDHDPAKLQAMRLELAALGSSGLMELPLSRFGPLSRQGVTEFFDLIRGGPTLSTVERWSIAGKEDSVDVPSLNIGGWYDLFTKDTIAFYLAMRARGLPTKLVIGPWTHLNRAQRIGDVDFGPEVSTLDLAALHLRWFDHWLKGNDTGLLREPPVKLFIMGANVWRDENEWPLARAIATNYYLRAGRRLAAERPATEAPDEYSYDPANPVPTVGGGIAMTPEYVPGPLDQRVIEARPDVLSYTTEPLSQDLEVTGPVVVRLWAASSAPDTDFVARLVDVHPDGKAIGLADGIIRARHRNAALGESVSFPEPGRPYLYTIDLWATANLFKAGHAIRLDVTSSSFPHWDRNLNTAGVWGVDASMNVARQSVLHDAAYPSHVVLPIVSTASK